MKISLAIILIAGTLKCSANETITLFENGLSMTSWVFDEVDQADFNYTIQGDQYTFYDSVSSLTYTYSEDHGEIL